EAGLARIAPFCIHAGDGEARFIKTGFIRAIRHDGSPRPGETPFQAGGHVEERRRKSENFLIPLVQGIAQIRVSGEISMNAPVEVQTEIPIAAIPEQSVGSAVGGFDIEIPATKITQEVRIQPLVMEGGDHGARLLRAAYQRLPEVIILLGETDAAV